VSSCFSLVTSLLCYALFAAPRLAVLPGGLLFLFVAVGFYSVVRFSSHNSDCVYENFPSFFSLSPSVPTTRILNPTDKDLRGYWWTCVAVDAEPSTRIFTPATHVAETSRDPMRTVRTLLLHMYCTVLYCTVLYCTVLPIFPRPHPVRASSCRSRSIICAELPPFPHSLRTSLITFTPLPSPPTTIGPLAVLRRGHRERLLRRLPGRLAHRQLLPRKPPNR
jgi:hypothetical protein